MDRVTRIRPDEPTRRVSWFQCERPALVPLPSQTCKFFSSDLGFGNLRIDGWANRETRAPHVAVHLCIVFNVLFIYIGMPPRTNLVLDDAYNDHVYGAARTCTGKSLNDMHVECVESKAFKQYVSKSHVVSLLAPCNPRPGSRVYTSASATIHPKPSPVRT